jgi:hypothetical protein
MMVYKTHMVSHRFQKITHALLSAAYLFLSLYTVQCTFHHDPGPWIEEHLHHADAGACPGA